jgi:tetratricopeptide (TPR) repeat protein
VAERLAGYTDIPEEDRKKAKVFFDYGDSAANTGNFDYAIEMYMNGLAIDPDSVEAHQNLWDIALKRKASGGKGVGFMESMKLKRPTKDDKQNMLNSEKLLAMDPGNTDAMVGVLQNALRGGFYDTVMWMGPILQKANADSAKPDVNKFVILRDAYKGLKQWKLATDACHYAAMLRPDDMDLQNELKNLGAMDTMAAGNYGTARSFRDSVKDAEGQTKRLIEDKDIRTMDQLSVLIHDAEEDWKADPQDPGKIMKFVDILVKTEQPDYENRAIDLLQGAYESTRQFRFRLNIGKIRMAQMNRMERSLRQAAQANPNDADAKQAWSQFIQEKTNEELKEYELWADNYPTDSSFRYQVGIRMYQLQRFDEAIPILQQVRTDPKLRVDATIVLGRAFLDAGYADEAVDTLAAVIGDYVNKGDRKSIDMTYWYGRALEQKNDTPAAIKAYSQVTQWDFNYKDVQSRIKKLRGGGAAA